MTDPRWTPMGLTLSGQIQLENHIKQRKIKNFLLDSLRIDELITEDVDSGIFNEYVKVRVPLCTFCMVYIYIY